MKSRSRIEIITETTRETSFRVARRAGHAFFGEPCAACAGELLSINEAVRRTGIGWRAITRLVKSGEIHAVETNRGEIYVCAASLSNSGQTEKNL